MKSWKNQNENHTRESKNKDSDTKKDFGSDQNKINERSYIDRDDPKINLSR